MGSEKENRPHALCIPAPAQGHINPMLKLAKILHSKGFVITFINTVFSQQRLLRSDDLHGLPSFRFETIPDGLPASENLDENQDVPSLCKSLHETGLGPFKSVVTKVSASCSPVTCIVADFFMVFTLDAARELGVPEILFYTSGAGSLICFDQYPSLIEKGLMPLKDPSYLINGYLNTIVDGIPNMLGLRIKDIPSFIRNVHPGDEYMIKFISIVLEKAKEASAIIFNTFDELERDILDTLSTIFPPCYGIGPLPLLHNKIAHKTLASIRSNFWKEEPECLEWLDSKSPSSVIYVNFGSVVMITHEQLEEFCWGLSKSNLPFLWIIRSGLVTGDAIVLPTEFLEETRDRGLLASWCSQEQVLKHPSIGGFLTHSGWNSTIESVSNGVPMLCWPFFADQLTNCWLSCNKWGIGMEIDNDVKSDDVRKLVIELMNGEKGNEMRKKAIDWKKEVEEACAFPSGSSMVNIEKVIHHLQASSK